MVQKKGQEGNWRQLKAGVTMVVVTRLSNNFALNYLTNTANQLLRL